MLQFLVRKVNCHETATDLMQDTCVRIAEPEPDAVLAGRENMRRFNRLLREIKQALYGFSFSPRQII